MEETKTENTGAGQKAAEGTGDTKTGQEPKGEGSGIYYAKFTKPYSYEGKEYDGVDLEGIQNLTTKGKIEIDRLYNRLETEKPTIPTMSTMYAVCVAARITKLPIEFFYNMKNSEFRIVEAVVTRGFFMPV